MNLLSLSGYYFQLYFFRWLGGRSALRQPQAGSTVLLQIQGVSYGEPPTPSTSDLTLELDQY
jgi:hypothetical protein